MAKRSNPRTSDHTALELLLAPAKDKGGTGWGLRHDTAMRRPQGYERGIVPLVTGWAQYADEHFERFSDPIGDDYVLGPEWKAIGEALLGLLNGELGRLDGGTLDGRIRDILEHEGIELEE